MGARRTLRPAAVTRLLGTISSSRCQTTRATRLLRGRSKPRRAISYFTDEYLKAFDGLAAGGARRDRTDDLLLAKQALSQLSYAPVER